MTAPKSIGEQLVACWNRRDFDGYAALLHPEYSYTGPDGKMIEGGPQVGVQVAKIYADAFPDGVITVTKTLISSESQMTEFVCRGHHNGDLMGIPPSGNPVEIHVCNVVELKDGKVLREREYVDMAGVLRQIGVNLNLPASTSASAQP